MDLEEIEDVYRRELEEIEKNFLKAVADKEKSKGAEKAYKGKIKAARDRYYTSVNTYLEREKKNLGKKDNKKKEKETKQFKVVPGNFELSWWQRQKLRWGLFFFKKRFSARNKIRKNTPEFVSYQYYKKRLLFGRFFGVVGDSVRGAASEVASVLQGNYEMFKKGAQKALKYLSELPGKIFAKFFKKKGKEGEKKEEKT
ncbi:MAG: hypothetical protein ABH864_00965 [archaeon]